MDNGELRMENGEWKMEHMKKNIVKDKSFAFALRVVELSRRLKEVQKEFVLSRQFLRSGTAIGALIREAEHAQSRADFVHKLSIALKEANETDYWIELLYQSRDMSRDDYHSLKPDVQELIKLLVSIIKTTKKNLEK